jgi:hypothetical protein
VVVLAQPPDDTGHREPEAVCHLPAEVYQCGRAVLMNG